MTDTGTRTYSATEVARMIPGVTYRMLDYWCRNGMVHASVGADGTGKYRQFTEADIAIIRRVWNRVCAARNVLDAFTAGTLWRDECR